MRTNSARSAAGSSGRPRGPRPAGEGAAPGRAGAPAGPAPNSGWSSAEQRPQAPPPAPRGPCRSDRPSICCFHRPDQRARARPASGRGRGAGRRSRSRRASLRPGSAAPAARRRTTCVIGRFQAAADADQLQHPLPVGDGLVLDRPPEQQGDVRVVDVLGPPQQLRPRSAARPARGAACRCRRAGCGPSRSARCRASSTSRSLNRGATCRRSPSRRTVQARTWSTGWSRSFSARSSVKPAADVEGPEGFERELVVLLVADHRLEPRADGGVAPLHEDAAGLARVPGVGVLQQVDQLVAGEPAQGQLAVGAGRRPLGHDAPDAAGVAAGHVPLAAVLGVGVADVVVVPVGDVERPVGPDQALDRAEPAVGRDDEVFLEVRW